MLDFKDRFVVEVDASDKTGDWICLHRPECSPRFKPTKGHTNLVSRYVGPYLINRRIGTLTYELQLLAGSEIYLVFQVSKLKKCFYIPNKWEMAMAPNLQEIAPVYPLRRLAFR
ncbi:unnamed protein product [Victoria cruziana]